MKKLGFLFIAMFVSSLFLSLPAFSKENCKVLLLGPMMKSTSKDENGQSLNRNVESIEECITHAAESSKYIGTKLPMGLVTGPLGVKYEVVQVNYQFEVEGKVKAEGSFY